MENHKETFEYTYSAKQQEEIENIRRKYMPKQEDKMEQLRKLDREVTRLGTIWAIGLGTIGCLVFGVGMCCVMVWNILIWGIVIGVIGMLIMAVAMPVYKCITKKERERIAPQILALTEELRESVHGTNQY